MSKITICQGCYRVMLYKNSNAVGLTINGLVSYVDCCLQCSHNLSMIEDRTYLDMKNYVNYCRRAVHFFDPLEYKNQVHSCLRCKMKTRTNYCFECSWRILRTLFDKWMLKLVAEYIGFDEIFKECAGSLNASYLTTWVNSREA